MPFQSHRFRALFLTQTRDVCFRRIRKAAKNCFRTAFRTLSDISNFKEHRGTPVSDDDQRRPYRAVLERIATGVARLSRKRDRRGHSDTSRRISETGGERGRLSSSTISPFGCIFQLNQSTSVTHELKKAGESDRDQSIALPVDLRRFRRIF